ncbi:Rieske (2Fe-2S) protein [Pseudonocardia thermophila]|mgnify:CR=1 FL=1|uniref:Rieske (2Fe-2S) protein n=1 Tax=Pseudonocardia thermophila TaxID=1848 RepID=UPI00248D68E5|nr:Rieske (2Fe-2S) protein [Pseudonocardia thermophila]
MTPASISRPSRRTVLVGASVTCAAGVLSACSIGSSATASSAPAAPGTPLVPAADVPVGGGTILADQGVVVVQPTAGTFVAYSARCTHAGCVVGHIEDGAIVCPCHQSKFALADGAVLEGPAPRPLEKREVTVQGDSVTLA